MLVVDTSGSMGESGMATVRRAASAFLASARGRAGRAGVLRRHSRGRRGSDDEPGDGPEGRQRPQVARRDHARTTPWPWRQGLGRFGDRSIILLSDGGDTTSRRPPRRTATAALTGQRVRAEVIGFKTADSDNSVLAGFAKAGGGSVARGRQRDCRPCCLRGRRPGARLPGELHHRRQPAWPAPAAVVDHRCRERKPVHGDAALDFGAPARAPSRRTTRRLVEATWRHPSPLSRARGLSALLLIVGLVAPSSGSSVLAVALLSADVPVGSPAPRRRDRAYLPQRDRPHAAVRPRQRISRTGWSSLGDRVMDGRESTTKTMSLISGPTCRCAPVSGGCCGSWPSSSSSRQRWSSSGAV